MGIKSIFFNDLSKDEEKKVTKTKEVTEEPQVKFPTTTTKFPSTSDENDDGGAFSSVFSPNPKSPSKENPFLEKTLEIYEKGFTKLNQPGYDFFEFYKAILKGGIDNIQLYEMALEIGKGMDSNVSRKSLVEQAEYYLNEIQKVHQSFSSDGKTKRKSLLTQQENENSSLQADIDSLTAQMQEIQNQINQKKASLAGINDKYQPLISEIDLKLEANDVVKEKFVSTMNKVKNNINNNLK
jgi:hypothetical protein